MQLQLQATTEALEEVKPYSHVSKSTTKVNSVDLSSVSSSPNIISVGSVEIQITGTSMRLLTKMGYKGGGLGINGQGMIQPLEVMQRPRLEGLGYNEGQYSKVSEAPMTLMKPSRKKNDGNTSPSSYDNTLQRETLGKISSP